VIYSPCPDLFKEGKLVDMYLVAKGSNFNTGSNSAKVTPLAQTVFML
jgi:hypothetical protein